MVAPSKEQIDKARQKASQAQAYLQALEARQSEADRKRDTRRKIILGGLLIDAAGKDERYTRVIASLIDRISRDHDRQAFDSWEPPTPPPPSAAPSVSAPAAAPVPPETPTLL